MSNALSITFEDLTDSYEGTIPADRKVWAERKLDEAVRELLALIPSIPGRIANGTLEVELVKDKVVAAALRVVRNPTGIESEGEGDYNVRFRNTVASGDIWYPEKDLIQLGWELPDKRNRPRTVHAKATPGWGFPG